MCFFFMFTYLLFFRTCHHFSIPEPPPHTNLIQMILTLKLVGLAFEVNAAHQKARLLAKSEQDGGDGVKPLKTAEEALLKLSLVDIVHYSFNYIGVLTGQLGLRGRSNCIR
jgi:lysophospholipid acyltransferase 7